jgi:hypothetical protein
MSSIEKFLSENSSYKTLQYVGLSCSYPKNLQKAINFLRNKNFEEFSKYTDIPLNKLFDTDDSYKQAIIKWIVVHCKCIHQFAKILNNSVELDIKDDYNLLPMYYIAKYGSREFISLAIKKEVKITQLNDDGESLVSIIINRSDLSTNDIFEFIWNCSDRKINFLYVNKKRTCDIDQIINKFKNDGDSLGIIKRDVRLLPYITFHFDMIANIFANETFEDIRKFLETFKMDIDQCITYDCVERYFEAFIIRNLPRDNLMIFKINQNFNKIGSNPRLSSTQKKSVADEFNDIFLQKLNIYDLWLRLVTEMNMEYREKQKNMINIAKTSWR